MTTPQVKGAIPQCGGTEIPQGLLASNGRQQRYLQVLCYKGVHGRINRLVELLSPRLRRSM